MSRPWAIEFQGVSKTFGRTKRRVQAVRDLSLQIAPGQVYGFLGPNGAGKTTSIRMMMDLVRPTEGHIKIFGQPVHEDSGVLRRKVGALVEGASFYDYLTGRRNLELLARTQGQYKPQQVQKLLERVGMAERADRKVGGYSTGMQQRLGIAAALLHDPELVILDEPTNGLDPGGIQEIRTFIRQLVARDGKTVFLSSHMLGEVEQVCDRVAIIDKGRLIREDGVGELLAKQAMLQIEATPVDQALSALVQFDPVQLGAALIGVSVTREQVPELLRRLVVADVAVYQVTTSRQRLEDVFLAAVQEDSDA